MSAQEANRISGTIAWWNRPKGFGVVRGEGGTEFFLHHSAVEDHAILLGKGDVVQFTAGSRGAGRQKALNVVRLAARPPTRCTFGGAGEEQTDG